MKPILFAAALLALALAPLGAHAACTPADFQIQNFRMGSSDASGASRFSVKGQLVNHCAQAAAAQVTILAKDAEGKVVQTKKGWPAGTANLAPGEIVDFDLGRLFHNNYQIKTFTAGIASVRTW